MVELLTTGPMQLRMGFAGDCFNTAHYARQALGSDWEVEFFSVVGNDAISRQMLGFMAEKQVGTRHVLQSADRTVGLYMVHIDHGERSFSYWRSASAARLLADDPDRLFQAISEAEIVFYSGITLAILSAAGRRTLLASLAASRDAGKLVAFDPNIRPRLWEDPATMRAVITEGARSASIVLPSFDDEATYFGDPDVQSTIARYRELCGDRVVVKDGERGATLSFNGLSDHIPAVRVESVVDTTGAGDSFNGSFLAHLARHGDPRRAAAFASKVAAQVIRQQGAIIDHSIRDEP
ncbi:sugar kinase [Tabrizicola sp. YIM 78059]|uniref:sugar kinase n=1 Tax=Tabrizicola sp. YIM 78059 TaxID=2529861 RepID=UPI0020C0AE6D